MGSPVFTNVRIPSKNDLVFKDECCFSFDNPESETGLYVCLNRFISLGKKYVESYFNLTGNNVFLQITKTKKEKKVQDEPEAKKPTRLAIGIEGGFSSGENNNFEYDEKLTVVSMPGWIKHPTQDLPAKVMESIEEVMKADSAAKRAEMEKLTGTWDGEMRIVSVYAKDLVQLDNGKKIPPSGWKCECCDIKENLWMNLTDGSIKCGRQFFDGSGGNNHALEHYKATGYPLAVKLGTINPSGADVFSYAEDDMIEDPYLPAHLAHFGIDILKMHKTDKSMVELEVELNQRAWEWSALCESDSELQPMYGPSFTGLWNLGNSCYINSVIQVLFNCLPSFRDKYYNGAIQLSPTDNLISPAKDFQIQIRKLAHGLLSGDYSVCTGDKSPQAVKPVMFKNLIGQGHVEFSTNKQQDAAEYILHLFSIIEKHTDASSNPTNAIKFKYEDRIECSSSGKVRYLNNRHDFILQLPVDLSTATNRPEVEEYEAKKQKVEASGGKVDAKEQVRACITLESCLKNFVSPCTIDDFYSPAIQAKTQAKKSTKLSTLPDFLFLQIQKFTMGEDWLEKKLDISLQVPDLIDLACLRGSGRQPGEEDLPESPVQATPAVTIDTSIVSQLMEMGFPLEGSRRAAYHTSGQGFEAAVNWVMEHSGDPDFDSAFEPPSSNQTSSFIPDVSHVEMLQCMGFPRDVCIKALKLTNNSLEEAVEKLTSETMPDDPPPSQQDSFFTDGTSKYQLQAFISHMGSSCKSGHYVCHILKGGQWVIYNDEKVALSHKPPKDLAYIYLYKRVKS